LLTVNFRADGSTKFGGIINTVISLHFLAAWKVSDESIHEELNFQQPEIESGLGINRKPGDQTKINTGIV
jgi:hypothetical protein